MADGEEIKTWADCTQYSDSGCLELTGEEGSRACEQGRTPDNCVRLGTAAREVVDSIYEDDTCASGWNR